MEGLAYVEAVKLSKQKQHTEQPKCEHLETRGPDQAIGSDGFSQNCEPEQLLSPAPGSLVAVFGF